MSNPKDAFPHELLRRPPKERLHYFVSKVVAHPHLTEAYQALLNLIDHPCGATLAVVCGPTGAGKTTLRLRTEQQLIKAAQAEMARDLRHVPVASLEVSPPDGQSFSWKDLYRRMLVALHEPPMLIVQKRLAQSGMSGTTHQPQSPTSSASSIPAAAQTRSSLDLRWAVERSVRERRPAAILIDEAQHLNRVMGARTLQQQMDVLKSLASATGVLHVLIGTYELLNMINLSAQLARRSVEIHFPRYRADNPHDMVMFTNVVFTFERHLPLAKMPDLVAQRDFLYEGSAGCVGTLKDWLTRAYKRALDGGSPTLTRQHLERSLDRRKQMQIVREILEGEEALRASSQTQQLRSLLGMDLLNPAPSAENTSTGVKRTMPTNADGSTRMRSQRSRSRRAGQRLPKRDPVGKKADQ
ncbi:MAG: AAA family ATPase [Anaerolineae bacterium]|nr:AAA family ATPase [Anaerolineae bacterium]